MVDDKKLLFNPAVELSYLTKEGQGKLDRNVMDAILTEERPAPVQGTLKKDRLRQYFPQYYTSGTDGGGYLLPVGDMENRTQLKRKCQRTVR